MIKVDHPGIDTTIPALADAIPVEMERVRHVMLSDVTSAPRVRALLRRATVALSEGNVAKMVSSLEELKSFNSLSRL
jgi:hypothetical protein